MAILRTLKTGVSGVRGVVGDSLTPQLLVGFGQAFGTYLEGGVVVIGRDTRPSGEMARHALIGGLLATGCHVIDSGVAPAPAIQYAVRRHEADGGIAITASHNPPEWNALKFIYRDGILLRPYQAQELLSVYYQRNFALVATEALGQIEEDAEAIEAYLEHLLRALGDDFELIRARRPVVVVDACNGAGALAAETFLYALGCEAIVINDTPDGHFPHSPEPIPENLQQLAAAVREHNADIGFALDPDADRVCVVNERGEALSEEYTIGLACDALPPDCPGAIVVNLSTSRLVEEAAARQNRRVIRTPVGEINVVTAMLREQAALGGEGTGGVIWPDAGYGKDAFAAIGLILAGLARRGSSVSEWQRSFRPSTIVKRKIPCPTSLSQPLFLALQEAYAGEAMDLTEGIRLTWPDGAWLHIRASNTEPVLRIVAEADAPEIAAARADQAEQYIRQALAQLER